MTDTKKLRLRATGQDELEIIAAAVQDAIFAVGQARFDARGRSFTLRLSRFRHESDSTSRIESGLRLDGVLNVRSQAVSLDTPEAFAVILGLEFVPTDAPSGLLNITLAGGGVLQVYIEAIDMTLADIGEAKATKRVPTHDI